MPRVSVPRVSLPRASVSGPLSRRRACDRSPRAHASFPSCRALHFHMRLRVACMLHGQAPHWEGRMRGRSRAARLVWSVCGTTIRMCREIMYTRLLSRGWWPRVCVGCGRRAGVAQKKRPPACLVATASLSLCEGQPVLLPLKETVSCTCLVDDRCRRAGFARPCAGAVAEGAWEKPRRPHHASQQPVPARRKSGARRACLAPDRDTLCTRTSGDARGHAAHGHGGASSVQERGRKDERASGPIHYGRLQPVWCAVASARWLVRSARCVCRRSWVSTVCWRWRGGAPAEASRRSVPRLLCFVIDVARRGCVS